MPAPSPDSTSPEGARSRAEKILRRQILLALSKIPGVIALVNEANVFTQLTRILPRDLVGKAHQAILPEERYGLGIGSPDLVVLVNGSILLRELKTEEGALSPAQKNWHARAWEVGVFVRTWRSVDEAVSDVERVRATTSPPAATPL